MTTAFDPHWGNDMKHNRRTILTGTASALSALLVSPRHATAQTYPDKPIRVIVPFAAGGGVDNVTRVVTQFLGPRLNQPIVVENRPGGNANIGSDAAAKALPDGYTFLMGATFLAFNRATMKNLPYDSVNDLIPIARVARAPFVLVVPSTLPVATMVELIAYLKANEATAAYGTVGVGFPTNHIFVKSTATNPTQVPYKGGAAAMPDLISGRITFMIQTSGEVLSYINSGKLRALAVTGSQRFGLLPNVPTMAEAGIKDLETTGWWGAFLPAKTPPEIVTRLSSEFDVVLKMPEAVEAMRKIGAEVAHLPAPEFAQFFGKEVQAYAEVAQQFNLVVE
jgi:tripartite-type tricarboxylate transporter receptor subunit TctC